MNFSGNNNLSFSIFSCSTFTFLIQVMYTVSSTDVSSCVQVPYGKSSRLLAALKEQKAIYKPHQASLKHLLDTCGQINIISHFKREEITRSAESIIEDPHRLSLDVFFRG